MRSKDGFSFNLDVSQTAVQLMQIVGEKAVRVVPDVAVSGTGGGLGLAEGLLGILLRDQAGSPSGSSETKRG